MSSIAAQDLRDLLAQAGSRDWALLDVRERGESDAGHIFGATFLPRRLLEFRIEELVPARSTRIVVYDDGDGRAELAAATLQRFGFKQTQYLAGGMPAWRTAGGAVTTGSNVPSKAFGERVHVEEHPPAMRPTDLRRRLDAGERIVICDVRTPEEYAGGHIPGGYEAPSFEVALGAFDLAEQYDAVVVNCAGRTRSIIASRTLQLLGVPNVFGLENGTSGWLLEDWQLERGEERRLPAASSASRERVAQAARALAESVGVGWLGPSELERLLRVRPRRTVYAFDVRSVPAYREEHVPGSIALPGGQAVQRADDFIAVPAAAVVLIDDGDARAWLTAYWLRRLGYPLVAVLEGGLPAWRSERRPLESGRARAKPLGLAEARMRVSLSEPGEVASMLAQGEEAIVIDVGTSRQYAAAHLEQAKWLPRGWLELRIGELAAPGRPLVVTARDERQALLAAAALADLHDGRVTVLRGGVPAWQAAGLPVVQGEPRESYGGPDFVLPPYEQGREGMLRYLNWEVALVQAEPAADGHELKPS